MTAPPVAIVAAAFATTKAATATASTAASALEWAGELLARFRPETYNGTLESFP